MPIITQTDLTTNIYSEIITEITRADTTITDSAINTAIQEAKMYLGRYDLVQLFGTDSTLPSFHDEYLKSLVKDIACWHLLRLSNAGVDFTAYRTAYQDAISALKSIMSGQVSLRIGRTSTQQMKRLRREMPSAGPAIPNATITINKLIETLSH